MPRSTKPKRGTKRKRLKKPGQRKGKTKRVPPVMSPMCDALAYVLRGLRKRSKLTLAALAKASGVCRTMISYVERRLTRLTVELLEKLAKALGVGSG